MAGTGYTLHYQSDRVTGYTAGTTVVVPVTASTPPPSSVQRIDVQVDIDGETYEQEYCLPGGEGCEPGAIDLAAGHTASVDDTIAWNHEDGFGRPVIGGRSRRWPSPIG